jgi:hypothetical protein
MLVFQILANTAVSTLRVKVYWCFKGGLIYSRWDINNETGGTGGLAANESNA